MWLLKTPTVYIAFFIDLGSPVGLAPDKRLREFLLDNSAPFSVGVEEKLFGQVQHLSQPVHHYHLQLGASWT